MTGQWFAYWIIRTSIALAGAFVILGTLISHFIMPELYYDDRPEPPALRYQMASIMVGLAVGALMLLPYRWFLRGWLYWPRLALSSAVGLFCLLKAMDGFIAYQRGGIDPAIIPVAIFTMLIGISLPGSLWWRRRQTVGSCSKTTTALS